jgi:hypothetical protein
MAAVRPRSRDLSGEQRRALEILAGSPHGCTEETLRAHGFTVRLLASIVRAGFAVAKPEIVKARGRTLSMLRLTITNIGRRTLPVRSSRERWPQYAARRHGAEMAGCQVFR